MAMKKMNIGFRVQRFKGSNGFEGFEELGINKGFRCQVSGRIEVTEKNSEIE